MNELKFDHFFSYFLGSSLFDNKIQYKNVLSCDETFLYDAYNYHCFELKTHRFKKKIIVCTPKKLSSIFFTTPLYHNLKENFAFLLNQNVQIKITKLTAFSFHRFKKIEMTINNQPFCVLITPDFFEQFFLKKQVQLENFNYEFSDFFYKKLKIFDFDFIVFLSHLSSTDIQLLLNTLLKEKKMDMSMLNGVMLLPDYASLFLPNLSTNVKQHISSKGLSKLWAYQSLFLMKEAVQKLIEAEKLHLKSLYFLFQWKIEKEMMVFQILIDKIIANEIFLSDVEFNSLSSFLLAKALFDIEKGKDYVFNRIMSKRKKVIFQEDFDSIDNLNLMEKYHAKMQVLNQIIDFLYKREKVNMNNFFDLILSLDNSDLFFIIEQVGLVRFSKAFFKSAERIKKEVLGKLHSSPQSILKNIFSNQIRYKEAFGLNTIQEVKNSILKNVFKFKMLNVI